jgi:hypothetical protein
VPTNVKYSPFQWLALCFERPILRTHTVGAAAELATPLARVFTATDMRLLETGFTDFAVEQLLALHGGLDCIAMPVCLCNELVA